MSTRCQIQVQGSPILIYKHSDGYPEGVLPVLEPFAKAFAASRGEDPEYCLAQIIRSFAFEEIEDKNDKPPYRYLGWGLDSAIHGDIAYLYIVDSKAGTVTVHESGFKAAYKKATA